VVTISHFSDRENRTLIRVEEYKMGAVKSTDNAGEAFVVIGYVPSVHNGPF